MGAGRIKGRVRQDWRYPVDSTGKRNRRYLKPAPEAADSFATLFSTPADNKPYNQKNIRYDNELRKALFSPAWRPTVKAWTLERADPDLPPVVGQALGAIGEIAVTGIGPRRLLDQPLTAIFCSARCPGAAILEALNLAQAWRKAGVAVVSGFHSPVEQESLRVLLDGESPIVVCLARSAERYRVPQGWRNAVRAGRLLVLSPFQNWPRVTTELAERRNLFVGHLTSRIKIVHAEPGSKTERLNHILEAKTQP